MKIAIVGAGRVGMALAHRFSPRQGPQEGGAAGARRADARTSAVSAITPTSRLCRHGVVGLGRRGWSSWWGRHNPGGLIEALLVQRKLAAA